MTGEAGGPSVVGNWSIVPTAGLTGLENQLPEWRAALQTASTERLFLEPEWTLPWLDTHRRPSRALFAAAGEARAAAIFDAHRLGPARTGPLVLRPPGLGVSDYLDLLLPGDREQAAAAAGALLDWLIRASGWDLLDLPNLPNESPTADLLAQAAAERGLGLLSRETHPRPYVRLEGSWEQYLASRPQKLRYNLRSRRRRLAELGDVGFRHSTTPDEVAGLLDGAVGIHAHRWAGQHTSTTFSRSATARRFYAEACTRMAGRGWVDLSMLELNGRAVAFCLAFVYGEKLYYYLPAFEPAYAAYGPSVDLLAHLIETAYARGLREVDLMLGDEPYKEPWATGQRGTTRVVVAAPGARGRAALVAFRGYLALREQARRSALVQRVRRYGVGELKQVVGARMGPDGGRGR